MTIIRSILLGLILFSCSALAYFQGPYVGFNVGYWLGDTSTNHTLAATVLPINTVIRQIHDKDLFSHSAGGGVQLGWGWQRNSFYLGGELVGNWFDAVGDSSMTTVNSFGIRNILDTKLKVNQAYRLVLRPGWLLDADTLLFFDFGASVACIKITDKGFYDNGIFNPGTAGPLNNSQKKFKVGPVVSLGIEQAIATHWAVSLQYMYQYYGHLQHQIAVAGVGDVVSLDSQFRDQVQSFSTWVALNYYFHSDVKLPALLAQNYSGFLLGYILGLANLQTLFNTSYLITQTPPDGLITRSAHLSTQSFSGGLALGFGRQIKQFYLGLLLSSDFSEHVSNDAFHSFAIDSPGALPDGVEDLKVKVKIHDWLSVVGRLGFVKHRTLLFVMVGMTYAQIKQKSQAEFNSFNNPVGSTQIKLTENQVLPILGFGIEKKLTKHVSISLMDVFQWYREYQVTGPASPNSALGGINQLREKFCGQSNKFLASVYYYM